MLFMPVLWRNDQPLGVLGSFVDWRKKTLLFFVAGRDESCHDLPIGLLLHGHSIRWAIEHGITTYDFLAGNEPYKYSYGVKERLLQCITLTTKSTTNLNDMLDPRCIDAASKKARRSHRERMLEQAGNGYRQVLQVRPDDLKTLGRYARLLTETGDYAKALTMHLSVVGKHPEDVVAWIGMGESYFAMGAYLDACLALERAVGLSSNKSIKAFYYLGRALLGLDRTVDATAAFHAVLELTPSSRRDEKRQLEARQYFQSSG
jgi:tetratricopeptide (TPR) repeat protein